MYLVCTTKNSAQNDFSVIYYKLCIVADSNLSGIDLQSQSKITIILILCQKLSDLINLKTTCFST